MLTSMMNTSTSKISRKLSSARDSGNSVNIFDYFDYRLYLNDLAQSMGVTGRISFPKWKQVIQGSKNTRASDIIRMIKSFNLDQDEKIYLRLLLIFDKAESLDTKKDIFRKLLICKERHILNGMGRSVQSTKKSRELPQGMKIHKRFSDSKLFIRKNE